MATNTITDLLSAASYADLTAQIHQDCCRQRKRLEPCKRCDDLEGAVLATDQAIRDHFTAICQEVSR